MVSQLIDMEWKFGLTASTNHIDKVGNAFLQIKLVYNNGQELQSKFLGKFKNLIVLTNLLKTVTMRMRL